LSVFAGFRVAQQENSPAVKIPNNNFRNCLFVVIANYRQRLCLRSGAISKLRPVPGTKRGTKIAL